MRNINPELRKTRKYAFRLFLSMTALIVLRKVSYFLCKFASMNSLNHKLLVAQLVMLDNVRNCLEMYTHNNIIPNLDENYVKTILDAEFYCKERGFYKEKK